MLVMSALGYPLTQVAIQRLGRRGALVVQAVCSGLLARDAAMLALGAPSRLRRGPALLLRCDAIVAAAAVLTGLRLVLEQDAWEKARQQQTPSEALRRGAVGLLFGLHTVRFWIYLQPDKGRRATGD